ncbi:MAG: hypothetical protein F6J87_08720 [Spirulina sp. SIO3F2]|nr:hypothetical protein [Spirulina sp. SIO3F2]
MSSILTIPGIIKPGYQVASGRAADSPYPEGSVVMQMPFFKALGLDLSDCFGGTLNVDIAPQQFTLRQPDYTFRQVEWFSETPPEDFSFVQVRLTVREQTVAGWIYYPHPETKPAHFQDRSTLEVVAPWVEGVRYGDGVVLDVSGEAIALES